VALRARREANRLQGALRTLTTQQPDLALVVLHYAPTASTLGLEPTAKYWMLGSSELGRVIDRHHVDLVLHGHAHLGNPAGRTPGGVPVLNVAAPVTGGITIHECPVSGPSSDQLAGWSVVGQTA
jgi:Icc-related predicted phosphoesterase